MFIARITSGKVAENFARLDARGVIFTEGGFLGLKGIDLGAGAAEFAGEVHQLVLAKLVFGVNEFFRRFGFGRWFHGVRVLWVQMVSSA